MTISKFSLAFIVLLIFTVIFGTTFYCSLEEYHRYYNSVIESESGVPDTYYSWNGGVYRIIVLDILLVLWIPFIWYTFRKHVYSYLKQKLTHQELKRHCHSVSRKLYKSFYGFVLSFFKNVNQKVKSNLAVWYMRLETLEHVNLLIKVFKFAILPLSVFYIYVEFYFFDKNVLASVFIGILLFFYSNFLPDLPSIFRMKIRINTNSEKLPWYRKYVLLLFAPFLILALFAGKRFQWRTTETFHNFKSLAIYGVFLLVLGFLTFADLPISIGDIPEILSLPLYGLTGYLTHLKVDLCF